ncbi:succinyldiaminopimelate aminotransferase apoenzyme [Micromonospora matsumotoense]|uniref:Succinyldiaminopimelate aminotransferase apoenzyme n=1 Tax=Micromonospora matsumotoense TaxID=121616 RepID=A0A1C5AN94_9ACTN|nr:pyridoxal phosphate-dependent aminotransferase [Micromonospora matsumotoense]SCF46561.1 succinyldiaminopimelate aminotransferase apoenzyme [Micromonospora matsumotoense]
MIRVPACPTGTGSGTTIFTEVTALAQRTGAVNLGQGFPDTDGPPAMLEAARTAIAAGANQYPPLAGLPELREAIVTQRALRYGTHYDVDTEVLVTTGATEALAAALLAHCAPDDEVIVFEPYYDSYAASIALAGGRRRVVPMRPDATGRFGFDPDDLSAAVSHRSRVLLLNSPHNPTGTVFDAEELAAIADCCRRNDLVAVTDEVYEYLTYDGAVHTPLATLPGMRERTLSISSAGKTFSATGWKVGWVCGPAHLVEPVRRVKQYLTFASGTAFQVAVAQALGTQQPWVRAQAARLQTNRDRLRASLVATGLTPYVCQGTYFLQADIRALGTADGIRFCRELPHRAGVAAIPSAVFYDDPADGLPIVRFVFCKKPEVLDEAARRLAGLTTPYHQEAV